MKKRPQEKLYSSRLSYSTTYHNSELKTVFSTTMTDIHDNGNFDLFKYQLHNKQKIVILYVLKNLPREIKDQICDAIDLAIDQELSKIDVDFYLKDNEWHINGS